MTILQQYGVFSGGELTKAPSSNYIFLSPYVVTSTGKVTGSGDASGGITKQIAVVFGVSSNDVNVFRELLEPPKYSIYVGPDATNVWVYYNPAEQDLDLSFTYPSGNPVFGKISWPANNGSIITQVGHPSIGQPISMATVDITYTDRTEAYLARTTSSLTGDKLYFESQRFVSGQLNAPLADIGVLIDVITAESSIRAGGSFFITLLQTGQVNTDTALDFGVTNMSVILDPCKSVARELTEFVVYDTKENESVSPHAFVKTFTLASQFQDKYLYVVLNKTTGAPDVIADASLIFGSSATYYPIARSEDKVGASATDLTGVNFVILNNITSLTRAQEDAAIIPRATEPAGFLHPVEVAPVAIDNTVELKDCSAQVLGYGVEILGQNITLSAPASSGTTVDVIWVEFELTASPTLVITKNIRTVSGNDTLLVGNVMENPLIFNNSASPVNFTKHTNGLYRAAKPENDYHPYTYGLPVAVIPRFNSTAFGAANPNGGTGRPDGRLATRPSSDEILVVAPTINRRSPKHLLGKNMQLLLKTQLLNALEQASYVSTGLTGHYSKRPLQIDYLGTTNPIGSAIGLPNGGRRLWSHNIGQEEVMSFQFDSNVDFSGYVGVYNNSGGNILSIKVPAVTTDTEIALDPVSGQPKDVRIVWASDGTPVKTLPPWDVGALNAVADINFDTADASWTSHAPGKILVQFKVRYTEVAGFTRMPSSLIAAYINDNPLTKYFPVNAFVSGEKLVSSIGPDVTIGSIGYKRQLWEEPVGSAFKFYSYKMRIPMNGNNLTNTPYQIAETYSYGGETYTFNGVAQVLDQYGNPVAIKETRWVSVANQFEVTLAQVIPSGSPVWFVMGVIGKELDFNAGSSEISNLTEAKIENPRLAPSTGIMFFSTGNLIYGFSSQNETSIIYLEDYAVPVTITGFSTNLLRIDMNITQLQYDSLSVGAQGQYVTNGSGGYKPVTNAVLKMGYLESRVEVQPIVLKYLYNASPLSLYNTAFPAEVVDRGFLIQTIDGSGNRANSVFSPLDTILPAVQGILATGSGVLSPSPVGLNDISLYQQLSTPFLEGTEIVLDGSLALNVRVNPPAGLAAWVCLIEQDNKLLLFVYEVRDGLFILNSNNQAFVAELQDYRRVR